MDDPGLVILMLHVCLWVLTMGLDAQGCHSVASHPPVMECGCPSVSPFIKNDNSNSFLWLLERFRGQNKDSASDVHHKCSLMAGTPPSPPSLSGPRPAPLPLSSQTLLLYCANSYSLPPPHNYHHYYIIKISSSPSKISPLSL